jgi:hypothetical protein
LKYHERTYTTIQLNKYLKKYRVYLQINYEFENSKACKIEFFYIMTVFSLPLNRLHGVCCIRMFEQQSLKKKV